MVARLALVALAVAAGCDSSGHDAADAGAPDGGDDLAVTVAGDLAQPVGDLSRRVPDGAVPRGLGYPCDGIGECDSGSCVDGYCCESLCDPAESGNSCKACNVPGLEGRCSAALAGTDPHQQCEPDPPAMTCGRDGLCDGAGGCRHRPGCDGG